MAQGLSMAWGGPLLSVPGADDLRDWICSRSLPRTDTEPPLRWGPGLQSDQKFQDFHGEDKVGLWMRETPRLAHNTYGPSELGKRNRANPQGQPESPTTLACCSALCPPHLRLHGIREGHKKSYYYQPPSLSLKIPPSSEATNKS